MIWSITPQPDLKLYITEQDLKLLISTRELVGKVFRSSDKTISTVVLKVDTTLANSTATIAWDLTKPTISESLLKEVILNWYIWWVRFTAARPKIIIAVIERLDSLLRINPDMSDQLKWWYDAIQGKFAENPKSI
jgi:hypothetical protein